MNENTAQLEDQAPGWQARRAHQLKALERAENGQVAGSWQRPGNMIQKVRYTHDAVIDLIIENPQISQNQIAATFGYTPGWLSQVMSSDAFKARLEARKDDLVDPQLRLTLNEKFSAMVSRSLDVLAEKLNEHNPDPMLALKAAELGAKSLGLGNSGVKIVLPSMDRIDNLASRLSGLVRPANTDQGVIDVQARAA